MNKIIFPLKLRMKNSAVGDLQDALQLLLDRGVILANDEGTRRELSAVLLRERAAQTYGSGTRKLVSIFQEERQLQTGGAVGEATAEALNVLLSERITGQRPPVHKVLRRAKSIQGGFELGRESVDGFIKRNKN